MVFFFYFMSFSLECNKMNDLNNKKIKEKTTKKSKKKTDYETYLEDINKAWYNKEYSGLAYSGTAVSTPTDSSTVETVFGKTSEIYKEWYATPNPFQQVINKINILLDSKVLNNALFEEVRTLPGPY